MSHSHPPEYSQELELILVKIAKEHAPKLVPATWGKPGDLSKPLYILARQLADYHIFTLIGYRGEHYSQDIPGIVRDCADTYAALYHLFIGVLYPSLDQNRALYYSFSRDKLLLYFRFDARPVAQVFAGFIAPYVVERQATNAVSDFEIEALLSKVLQKLDADDLSRAETHHIMTNGKQIIKRLLGMPLRHMPLTRFDEKFFSAIEPPTPPDLPEGAQGVFTNNPVGWDDSDQPDFLRNMNQTPAQQPRPSTQTFQQETQESAPRNRDDDNLKGETGVQPAINHPDDPPPAQPPARRGLRSPLPYWRDDKKSDS